MSITYEEALETLKSMFGDPWTEQTLDAVLRHHEGHMENTVETVLSHGDGDPADLVKRLQDPTAAAAPGSSVADDEAIARQLAAGEGRQGETSAGGGGEAAAAASGGAGGGKKQRGTPTQLPPDFLRIPGQQPSGGGSGAAASAAGLSTLESDEQLARMLQDELFTRELANNPEFAHLAGQGRGRGAGGGAPAPPRASGFGGVSLGGGGFPGLGRGRGGGGQHQQEGPNVMDKLTEMGESTRKKLTLFAQQFNERMRNPHGPGGAPPPAPAAERRGLLDLGEEEEEEEVAFLGQREQDSNVEMGHIPPSPGGKKDN